MAKDILKNSIWYTILGFLPLSISFVFAPLYLQYLDEAQYGILNLFVLYTGIFTQIYDLGIGSAFGYLYWDVYKDKNKLKELMSSTLGLMLLFQFILISIGLFFGESIVRLIAKSSEFSYNPIFIILILVSAFMAYNNLFLYYFRNQDQVKKYAIISVSTLLLLTIGTLLGVVYLDLKAIGAIYGRSIGYFLIVGALWIWFVKRYGIKINLKASKQLLVFGIPLFLNTLIGAFGYSTDRILIERLDTLSNLGIYAFATIVVTFLEVIFNALNNAIAPTLYKYVNEAHVEKRNEIIGLSYTVFLIVLVTISLVIAGIIPAVHLVIPENFHEALRYVPILASAFIWRVFTTLCSFSIYTMKKTKYLLINQSSNILFTIILGYLGYQLYGIIGIAYAIYLVRIIEFFIIYIISQKVKPLGLKLQNLIILAIILGLVSFTCSNYFDHDLAYLIYFLPLGVCMILTPLFARKEIKLALYMIRNRKALFG